MHTKQPLGGLPDPTILAGPYAVTLARLPPRLHLPPHAHEQASLNVVLDGEYGKTVERGAFQFYGSATLIAKPAGTVHDGGRLRTELARRDDVTLLAVEGLVFELLAELERTPLPRLDAGNRWLTRARDLLHDEPGPRDRRVEHIGWIAHLDGGARQALHDIR